MEALKLHAKNYKEANELIRKYFRECLPTIDDNNLYMLRKLCMYISIVYVFMLGIGKLVLADFKFMIPDLLIIPLIMVYFNINLYTMRHRGEISTAKTAAICCTFYFILGVILGAIDVFKVPAGQAIWLPIAVIALPMIFIDRIYKYGFEELVVLSIMLLMSYFNKSHDVFMRDLYISITAYVISMLSARIILEMRARETLAMEEVTRLSALDKLTHVLNKDALLQRIESYFIHRAPEESCAMCIIDLDDFKLVNDNLGHDTGDVLLERLGQLLIENFRAYDIVGRYGGDEFVVVMPRLGDSAILESRCKALQMFVNDLDIGSDHRCTISIGAIISTDITDSKQIFSMADDALYKSKIQGKNCCTIWSYAKGELTGPGIVVLSKTHHDGIRRMIDGERNFLQVVRGSNDDETLRYISQYHSLIRLVMIEVDVETGLGLFTLKYLKQREGFSKLPVLAVTDSKKAAAIAMNLGANDVIEMDAPDDFFKRIIRELARI